MHSTITFCISACLILFTACNGASEKVEEPVKTISKKDPTLLVDTYVPTSINPIPRDELVAPTPEEAGAADEVAIIITSWGRIVAEFYPDIAPLHVANFKKLANAGFYDGCTFHRVVPGFVIQGGDPNSKDGDPRNDGLGGPPWKLKAEFSDRPHKLGILSMARSGDPNSGGSQFFICLGRAKNLDNKYTVFGNVIHGIEVVKDIGSEVRDPRKNADKEAVKMKYVRIVKRSELGL